MGANVPARHIAYGLLDAEQEVSAHVTDLNEFLCVGPDADICVFDTDGNQLTLSKGSVDWYRIQPLDRV